MIADRFENLGKVKLESICTDNLMSYEDERATESSIVEKLTGIREVEGKSRISFNVRMK